MWRQLVISNTIPRAIPNISSGMGLSRTGGHNNVRQICCNYRINTLLYCYTQLSMWLQPMGMVGGADDGGQSIYKSHYHSSTVAYWHEIRHKQLPGLLGRSFLGCLPRSIILLSLHANIMHTNQDNTAATGGQSTVKMPIGRKSIININYARRTVLDDHWQNPTNTPARIYITAGLASTGEPAS